MIPIEFVQSVFKNVLALWCHLYSLFSDGSSVCTQDSFAPEKHIQLTKHTSNLELASRVMINPQQTSEPNEGETYVVQIENVAVKLSVIVND